MNGKHWAAQAALGHAANTLRDRLGMVLLGWLAVTVIVGATVVGAAMPGLLVLAQSPIAGAVVLLLLVPPTLAVAVPPLTMSMAGGWLAAHDRSAGWTAWVRPPGGLLLAWGQGSLLMLLNVLLALPPMIVSQGLGVATAGSAGEDAANVIAWTFSIAWALVVQLRFTFVPWLVIDRKEGVVSAFGTAWAATSKAFGAYLRVAACLFAVRLGGFLLGALLGGIAFAATIAALGIDLPDEATFEALGRLKDPVAAAQQASLLLIPLVPGVLAFAATLGIAATVAEFWAQLTAVAAYRQASPRDA